MGADAALVAATLVGVYYASTARRLFRGDHVMERVWRATTTTLMIIAIFSVLDLVFTVQSSFLLQFHLISIAAVFAVCIFDFAAMALVRWGRSSTEPRTQPSQQSPQP